jgi:hypothetical protein
LGFQRNGRASESDQTTDRARDLRNVQHATEQLRLRRRREGFMNGELDHLEDNEHLDLCAVCDKNPCECPIEKDDNIYSNIANAKTSRDLLNALSRVARRKS